MVTTTLATVLKTRFALANDYSRRWLRIQRVSGDVTMIANTRKAARVGDYLSSVGHGVITGPRSAVRLAIDDGIASVAVAQNTHMTIHQLSVLGDGARVTVLDVHRGQARFQVRRLTNPNSHLELRTPSGVAAVRGTTFGSLVHPDGQTNVATLEGRVDVSAQGASVPVEAGMVSTIYPGDVPTVPQPLDRELDIRWQNYEWRGQSLYVAGFINATNVLLIKDQDVAVNRTGYFEQTILFNRKLQVVSVIVQNPMGETRTHKIFPRGEI